MSDPTEPDPAVLERLGKTNAITWPKIVKLHEGRRVEAKITLDKVVELRLGEEKKP